MGVRASVRHTSAAMAEQGDEHPYHFILCCSLGLQKPKDSWTPSVWGGACLHRCQGCAGSTSLGSKAALKTDLGQTRALRGQACRPSVHQPEPRHVASSVLFAHLPLR